MEINGVEVEENIRYDSLGLSPELMQALNDKGYTMATPVQGGSIPSLMEWKDVVAKAPTGTGKTFAFGIPMIEHIDPENDWNYTGDLCSAKEYMDKYLPKKDREKPKER